ncbi:MULTISPECIES: type I glyceraldehyde-3-phosphate dehydrogenase [unclassified Sulfuricurvum]|uniref:type I glyceraldehyde-3-phosphate dehydrogenase n=1 Tax=unclassified Sulfuricurvum TaxID=2632390 RepID=UPI000299823F|nr:MULTISPECIES: type I glyceraldehyde-3-phosphate dehydrogenase [unclassified Sulfuricurvum]OHD84083.1 MAG: type I glyceraldehyde-3-phosphate dehydrogenase [Sulfuricurvum sp. RIFCSPLOWO2_02_43_6]OHD84592.1 MAG: type I glyceraldehyde-3-phosphate dehydrogenase [Sulfuricurvum sp. RIFCSPHIGHO2_12_FULL_44_8]OHD86618.1 MAG: type I glyceraldehyde-3-phosphate dehydrogenase [Sulfuricurvum sp. RIFCSPLOWO2_02_FULL_43_45]OHD91681.1 MAG: type I glyceraldehyde-3-phosphate dehydrogenase [Sulfuricurvum sp. RI
MALKVAINGTGRIGIIVAKIIAERSDIELVALNTTAKPEMLEYLLKFDSVHRGIDAKVIDENTIAIAGKNVRMFRERDIDKVDFGSTGAEVVIECTGVFLDQESCQKHLKNGIKKVIMSAPAKDDSPTYVYGVNSDAYKGEAIISNASCTTNCLGPICKVLDDAFGIENGLMTTIHSYTNDQNILDVKHSKDPRRARAAALNMIPTSTGAAKAIGKVMPQLLGKLNGYAMRVPTPDVSVVDLTVNLKKEVTKEDIHAAFTTAAEGAFNGLIEVDNDKRVSCDFVGSTYSSTYVPDMTSVVDGHTVKVLAWYDNEWGYSSRLVDMTVLIGTH